MRHAGIEVPRLLEEDIGGGIVLVGIAYDARKKAHGCVIEKI
nr:hypothetical protein [uncultured Acetatifactor sp.]